MYAPVALTTSVSVIRSNDVYGSNPYAVEHLSDAALLAGTRSLVARSNQQLARLLAHLAEVEARGIHRARACASLCVYCIYELRLSEDTAFRYARAAKLARRFPVLFEQVAAGEIHLTGLLLLGPHLSEENHREVLRLAKHRSKREIMQLVRRLDPLPDVPSRIEPLGPARSGQSLSNGTWSVFMQALNPVRELTRAERPSEWLQPDADADADAEDGPPTAGGAAHDGTGGSAERAEVPETLHPAKLDFDPADALDRDPKRVADVAELTPSSTQQSSGGAPSLNSQRYCVQFTATQEYVDLVERARDLLSHAVPNRSLAEVHLRAMRLLVANLEKRRFGAGQSARSTAPESDDVRDEPRPRRRTRGSHAKGRSVSREIVEPAAEEHARHRNESGDRDSNDRAPAIAARETAASATTTPSAVRAAASSDRDSNDGHADDRDSNDRDSNDRDSNDRDSNDRDFDDRHANDREADDREASDRDSDDRHSDDRHSNDRGSSDGHAEYGGAEPCTAGDFGLAETRDVPRRRGTVFQTRDVPRRRGKHSNARTDKLGGRYIPADVRREVANRDGRRCACVSADGQRCAATSFLELHHHDPYAQGGAAEIDNLSLYCRAHNALAAERDFGRTYMARRSGRE